MSYDEELEQQLRSVNEAPADPSMRERILASAAHLAEKHQVSREEALAALFRANPELRQWM